jgi:flagellar export protein FliJ
LRNWEEQRAKTAFGKARKDELLIQQSLAESEERIEADMKALRGGTDQKLPAGERALRWRHLVAQDEERLRLVDGLKGARLICEKSRKVLIDAHRRVRILEKLKSRQEQAHLSEMRRVEEREIEELVGARFQANL